MNGWECHGPKQPRKQKSKLGNFFYPQLLPETTLTGGGIDEGQSWCHLLSQPLRIFFPLYEFTLPPSQIRKLNLGQTLSPFPESIFTSFTSFTSSKTFWIRWKGTEGLGPSDKEGVAEEVTVPWAEGILQIRVLLNTCKLGSQPVFHLLFFPPEASCPRGGWRGVMGDFLTSTNKPFHCHWAGSISRPDRPVDKQ